LEGSPIQIGSISLIGFEVPTSVRFGGRHRLAIHNLSGGRRIVERLGPDDGEVTFQGTFSGADAEDRVRSFDNLRLSGEIVWLTWNSFRRRVVIKSFVADYHSPWWIPYKVNCVVVHQSGVAFAQTSTLYALLSVDLGNALSAVASSTVSLNTLQTALCTTSAMTAGTSSQAQALGAVETALSAINSQITLQSTVVTAPLVSGSDPGSLNQALSSVVSGAGLLAAAVNAKSYVGRIGTNLRGMGS
jgi:hypothetical protein